LIDLSIGKTGTILASRPSKVRCFAFSEDRRCEKEISGGNYLEAASHWLNSSSSKPSANLTASEALISSVILRFLALGCIDRFANVSFAMVLLVLALVRIGRFADAAVDRELKKGS